MNHAFRIFGRSRPVADMARLCLVIPPEPPVADLDSPQRRAAGKGAPVFGAAERTLACKHRCGIYRLLDGRIRWDHEALVNPAGELRAEGRRGIPKGEETVGCVPLWPLSSMPLAPAPDAALSIVLSAPPYSSTESLPPSPHGSRRRAPESIADNSPHSERSAPPVSVSSVPG